MSKIDNMKKLILPGLLTFLFICLGVVCCNGQWTQIENLLGVTTDIYFNRFGDRYICKKDGVLLINNDTFATYGVRTVNELGLLAVTEYGDQVCVYFSGLDSTQYVVCDNDTVVGIPYQTPFYSSNHVGGDLVVQDEILYISTGYGIQNMNDAQNPEVLRGKLLAWNGDSLWIHSSGLRNPWRFDVYNDTIYLTDVGWNTREELNVFRSDSIFNFGWPCWEGTYIHNDTCGATTLPAYEYDSGPGNHSIHGLGYYYDGFFFTDYYTGIGGIWRPTGVDTIQTPVDLVSGAVDYTTGILYAISYDGRIYQYDLILDIDTVPPKVVKPKVNDYDWDNYFDRIDNNIYFTYDWRITFRPKTPGYYFHLRSRNWVLIP